MDHYVSRTYILISRFRAKIKELALVQSRIYGDVEWFREGGKEVRDNFEESRARYLAVLELSVEELRDAMESEVEDPIYDTEVEEIMKRVRPITRKYLRGLVADGQITSIDMERILSGGYTSVEAYFEYLDANTGSFGVGLESSSSSSAPNSTLNNSQPATYDEGGFLIGETQGGEYHATKAATDGHEAESHSVLLQPSEPFSWADDVEAELEAINLARQQAVESLSASDPSDTEMRLSDTDNDDSDFDTDVDCLKSSVSSLETQIDIKSEQGEKMEIDVIESLADASSSSILDLPNQDEISKPALIQAYFEASRPANGDDTLDLWMENHGMWYWQYELIFAAKLLARRLKEDFQHARDAYKVDPFADIV
ncbi:hypothetical protein F5Y05DRAFT_272125 [Hypoxylon sp. FL0543]|nr:hypothetical protein F5Y05DRAFT_272125 [Hypoxylon sp. FL0543]